MRRAEGNVQQGESESESEGEQEEDERQQGGVSRTAHPLVSSHRISWLAGGIAAAGEEQWRQDAMV